MRKPSTGAADILLRVVHSQNELATTIHIEDYPGPNDEVVAQATKTELARRFAVMFACRTMSDASDYGDGDAPYWAMICDVSRWLLAGIGMTETVGGVADAVRIVRETPEHSFRL